MNIYIGNLSRDTTEDDLKGLFQSFGQINNVNIIRDKFSTESRGFGFVEMALKEEAQKAISELNGKDLKGKMISVNEARPRTERRSSGGGWGSRGNDRGGRSDYRGNSRRSW